MNKFPQDFYRGCRKSEYVNDKKNPTQITVAAFYPVTSGYDKIADFETCIHWDDDASALNSFYNTESQREENGNIKYGVGQISCTESNRILSENGLSDRVTFTHDPDPSFDNKYHGTIKFDGPFTHRESNGRIKIDKANLDSICSCFVLAQKKFYTVNELNNKFQIYSQ